MKPILRASLLVILVFIAYSCSSSKKTTVSDIVILPYSDTVSLRDGSIVYGLPRSVVNVIVELERTIEIPGPYAKYAGDLLGLDNVIKNEAEYWSVKSVAIKTNEELDPSEFYIIESNTLFLTNALALKKQGLIMDLNPEIFSSAEKQTQDTGTENNRFLPFDLGSDEYFQIQRDTAYRRVNIDSTFIRIPYVVEKKRVLSVDQLAEKAANRLMEMRDGKHLILTGEANVFPQNESVLNEMRRMEQEYTELFVGKTITETRKFSSIVMPEPEMVGKQVVLFRLSEMNGPENLSSKNGEPLSIEFIPEQKTKDLTIINKPQQKSADGPKFDKLFYRVPDVVNIKVNLGTETLLTSRRLIYQFGQVVQLPSNYIIGK
jgi:hypothetical protein